MSATPYQSVQWRELRPIIYERDGGVCRMCDTPVTPDAYDIDHIIPWEEGGAWFDPTNLRLTCPKCNRGRFARRAKLAMSINRQHDPNPSRRWR